MNGLSNCSGNESRLTVYQTPSFSAFSLLGSSQCPLVLIEKQWERGIPDLDYLPCDWLPAICFKQLTSLSYHGSSVRWDLFFYSTMRKLRHREVMYLLKVTQLVTRHCSKIHLLMWQYIPSTLEWIIPSYYPHSLLYTIEYDTHHDLCYALTCHPWVPWG